MILGQLPTYARRIRGGVGPLLDVGQVAYPLDDSAGCHRLESLVVDPAVPPAPVRRPVVMRVPVKVDVASVVALPLEDRIVAQDNLPIWSVGS